MKEEGIEGKRHEGQQKWRDGDETAEDRDEEEEE